MRSSRPSEPPSSLYLGLALCKSFLLGAGVTSPNGPTSVMAICRELFTSSDSCREGLPSSKGVNLRNRPTVSIDPWATSGGKIGAARFWGATSDGSVPWGRFVQADCLIFLRGAIYYFDFVTESERSATASDGRSLHGCCTYGSEPPKGSQLFFFLTKVCDRSLR